MVESGRGDMSAFGREQSSTNDRFRPKADHRVWAMAAPQLYETVVLVLPLLSENLSKMSNMDIALAHKIEAAKRERTLQSAGIGHVATCTWDGRQFRRSVPNRSTTNPIY